MDEQHRCDQVDYLRDLDQRITSLRAVLLGENGAQGFMSSTAEVLSIINKGVGGFSAQATILDASVTTLKTLVVVLTAKVDKLMSKRRPTWGQVLAFLGICVGVVGTVLVAIIYVKAGVKQ